MPTPEGRVKAMIKRWLKDRGYYYFMPVSAGYGTHGIPDFIVCARGTFVGIEAKAPGGKPTDRQQEQLEKIEHAGGIAVVVSDAGDLDFLSDALIGIAEGTQG